MKYPHTVKYEREGQAPPSQFASVNFKDTERIPSVQLEIVMLGIILLNVQTERPVR